MERFRKHPYLLIGSIIAVMCGIWLLFTDPSKVIGMIYFLVGGVLILTGIYKLLVSNNKDKMYIYDGAIDVIVGISFMFFHDLIITIILGLIFVIFPLVRTFRSKDKKATFKREIPLLIIGLVIALSGGLMGTIFVKILGGISILFGIYLFINIYTDKFNVLKRKKVKKEYHKRDDVIDVEYEERS
jgi:drug/metabolite transporter superfamily protein YnfA